MSAIHPLAQTVAQLLASAASRSATRRRREAEQAARDRQRREREEAERRDRYLDELAAREAEVWRDVDSLIVTKLSNDYDRAIQLLVDLRDLGSREGRRDEVSARIRALGGRHARKWSFIQRLEMAGLVKTES